MCNKGNGFFVLLIISEMDIWPHVDNLLESLFTLMEDEQLHFTLLYLKSWLDLWKIREWGGGDLIKNQGNPFRKIL